jgi:hypothetical protein
MTTTVTPGKSPYPWRDVSNRPQRIVSGGALMRLAMSALNMRISPIDRCRCNAPRTSRYLRRIGRSAIAPQIHAPATTRTSRRVRANQTIHSATITGRKKNV